MNIVRWALTVPIVVLSFYLAVFVGILLYSALDYFCPKELMISGMCTATWYRPSISAIFIFSSSLAAFLVVTSTALIAPNHKVQTTRLSYIIGLTVAFYFAYSTDSWWAFTASALTGLITVIFITKRFGSSHAS